MSLVMMKEICCGSCGRSTRHLASTLERIFPRLLASATDAQQTIYACPHCKHLGLVSVPLQSRLWHTPGQEPDPDDVVAFVVMLECAQEGCLARISVLAPMKPGTNESQAKQQMIEWRDSGLACQQGHPLRDIKRFVALLPR
jgi:hypothetical protein